MGGAQSTGHKGDPHDIWTFFSLPWRLEVLTVLLVGEGLANTWKKLAGKTQQKCGRLTLFSLIIFFNEKQIFTVGLLQNIFSQNLH